jgi:nucleoside-diphosphate-sugar epimerase
VERLLDIVERDAPRLRVVRVRPVLVGKRAAAAHLRRLFVGPFLPNPLLGRLPVGPTVAGLRLQLMHGDDVAAAMCRALLVEDARGAYNLTNEPVLTARDLAEAVGAVPLPVPAPLARGVAALAWRLHLQPTPPGWLDLAMTAPLLEAGRVRRELGWEPVHDAHATLAEVVGGLRDRADGPTPPLRNATSGPARLRELRTGVGRRT